MDLKTKLYDKHVASGAKMVSFAGYHMPLQYSGILSEHMAVRKSAGLFDVSHMGKLVLSGLDAENNIQYIFTNDFNNFDSGRVRYTLMCSVDGGVLDDLVVYKLNDNKFLLIVNASNIEHDLNHIKSLMFGDVQIEDLSSFTTILALQGPHSFEILSKLSDKDLYSLKNFAFINEVFIGNTKCLISRTGYTGEDGFEIYCDNTDAPTLWDAIIAIGQNFDLLPCGLGARDTLRLEAGMPLYGHELTETITPIEAGLSSFVKFNKKDFYGKKALVERGEPLFTRVGLVVTARGIPRPGCEIYFNGDVVGYVTSGTHSPYFGRSIAMGYVKKEMAKLDFAFDINVRGSYISAKITALPFYKKGQNTEL